MAGKCEGTSDEARHGHPRLWPDADHMGQEVAGVRIPSQLALHESLVSPSQVKVGVGWSQRASSFREKAKHPHHQLLPCENSRKHPFRGNHVIQCCGPLGYAPGAAAPPEAMPLLCTPRG